MRPTKSETACEVCKLKIMDIDFDRYQIHVWESKNNKSRYVVLSAYISQCLLQYINGADFQKRFNPPLQVKKTLKALSICRTKALGRHLSVCKSCGVETLSFNSCRNRHCPKCQVTNREKCLPAAGGDTGQGKRTSPSSLLSYCLHITACIQWIAATLWQGNIHRFVRCLLAYHSKICCWPKIPRCQNRNGIHPAYPDTLRFGTGYGGPATLAPPSCSLYRAGRRNYSFRKMEKLQV